MHQQAEKALTLAGTCQLVCQPVVQETEWTLAVNVHSQDTCFYCAL